MSRFKLSAVVLALTTAFSLTACVSNPPQAEQSLAAPSEPVRAAEVKSTSKDTKDSKKTAAKGGKNSSAKDKAATATATKNAGTAKDSAGEKNLLSGKAMSGRELMGELRSLRSGFSGANPLQSFNAMFAAPMAGKAAATGAAGQNAQAQSLNNFLSNPNGGSMASLFGDIALDMLVSELSYSAIDGLFGEMLDDRDLLSKVTVEVPDVSNLNPSMRKQVLNLSAYLVAIKASGMLIDSSQGEFEAAKNSYVKAMDMRQKAVRILGAAMEARAGLQISEKEGKKRGADFLSDPAHKELLEVLSSRPQEELLRDFAVQNLALAYVRKAQPEVFKDYKLEVEQVRNHYGAYVRTVTGTGSMLGFSALFLKKTKQLIERERAAGAVAMVPLLTQGLTEVSTLMPRIKKTLDGGDDMSDGSFKLVMAGQEKPVKTQLTAKKALSALDDEGLGQFRQRLFGERGNGLLVAMYGKNKRQTGMFLDRVTSKDARSALARDYLALENPAEFTFQNVYDGKLKLSNDQRKRLSVELLAGSLQSQHADAGDQALLKVQDELRTNQSNYGNSELRKLMFAAPQANQNKPVLALGKMELQIDALGVAGLAEYEEFAAGSLAHATVRNYGKDAKDKTGKERPASDKKTLSSL